MSRHPHVRTEDACLDSQHHSGAEAQPRRSVASHVVFSSFYAYPARIRCTWSCPTLTGCATCHQSRRRSCRCSHLNDEAPRLLPASGSEPPPLKSEPREYFSTSPNIFERVLLGLRHLPDFLFQGHLREQLSDPAVMLGKRLRSRRIVLYGIRPSSLGISNSGKCEAHRNWCIYS